MRNKILIIGFLILASIRSIPTYTSKQAKIDLIEAQTALKQTMIAQGIGYRYESDKELQNIGLKHCINEFQASGCKGSIQIIKNLTKTLEGE